MDKGTVKASNFMPLTLIVKIISILIEGAVHVRKLLIIKGENWDSKIIVICKNFRLTDKRSKKKSIVSRHLKGRPESCRDTKAQLSYLWYLFTDLKASFPLPN